ncbi:VirK family protein [Janthinobacterium agaricidamnosum]|uniref:Putative exported protein n=1 Tax=Janthinobacterium agaricidamnosum NBRC 102515 = DSM 9628 TaxID=1349767 RepID=W0VB90_9BURK|nr:VirK family protein [Janthinobacterium agaricidamnosum]CDG84527.1 putative exported protein [Janthinobacterium agaricidamnosum NBRC 102515 = DSM 9628]
MRIRLSLAIILATNLLLGIAVVKAEPVSQYEQLRTQLFAGVATTAIFSPAECQNPASTAAPRALSGGLAIRDFFEVAGKNIGFANQHLTVRADGTTVLELVQYRALPDDTGTVTVRSLSPVTYQPLSAAQVFQCTLGKGLRFVHG